MDGGKVNLYGAVAWPALARLDAERTHGLVLRMLALAQHSPRVLSLLERLLAVQDARLVVDAFGVRFPNPVGLAAGLDKDARAPAAFAALGFGAVEVGTVTPVGQAGNPRPRVFRLPREGALINRMGFPNEGAARVRARLLRWRGGLPGGAVLGVNLGKGAQTPLEAAARDYAAVLEVFHDLAGYAVINVSSPNTPGLRDLQARAALEALLRTVVRRRDALAGQAGRRVPLLVKVAPDLGWEQLGDVLAAIEATGIDGIVATNTTLSREGVADPRGCEAGGLSGEPLRRRSTEIVRWLARETGGGLPIVGVGGISQPDHALEKFDAGAALVQVYTGLVYAGPALPGQICRALLARNV
jgi:dihydroorotate dehydrogenase